MQEVPTIKEMTERGVIAGLLSMTQKFYYRPELCGDADIVAHFKPETDAELRGILISFDEFWEFDPTEAILTRNLGMSGGKVRAEIDCSQLGLADVLAILDETRPAW